MHDETHEDSGLIFACIHLLNEPADHKLAHYYFSTGQIEYVLRAKGTLPREFKFPKDLVCCSLCEKNPDPGQDDVRLVCLACFRENNRRTRNKNV